ncbi:DUF3971 domain-containing protein [Ancylobacter sp. 6x-1]|uniref:DUF3971 domain-containing protein n=1 Tax=Ancylobacter crimeensis TaxID=2579147 RepID=A0ABT0D6P6_9HYPH|nr:DUF3971 domain-containing protein [Ancylobacter crimeensis]MCK0195482.1 DUF3971 domain-containing protein [Ancylobacter crimeensis]
MTDEVRRKGGTVRGRLRLRRRARVVAPAGGIPGSRPRLRAWRVARLCGVSALGLCGLVVALCVAVYALVVSGFVGIDMIRPFVVRELEKRLGGGETVEIGSITSARSEAGDFLVRVNDIVVRNQRAEVIASAPQAEIGIQTSLLPWRSAPQRIALVGAELTVHLTANGDLTIATGRGAKPLRAPHGHGEARPPDMDAAAPAAIPPAATSAADATPPAGAAPEAPAAPSQAPAAPAAVDPARIPALAALANLIDEGGFGGSALTDIGLRNGTLRVESEASGRQWVFDHINLDVSRPLDGGVRLDFSSSGANGPWTARAAMGPDLGGNRTIELNVANLSPHDLMIAAGKSDDGMIATSPLGLDVSGRIDDEGRILVADGKAMIGAGKLQLGSDAAGMMLLDAISLALRFDRSSRVLSLQPLTIKAKPMDLALGADIAVPATMGEPWVLTPTTLHASFGGGGPDAEKEAPLVLDKVSGRLTYEPATRRLVIGSSTFSGAKGGVTLDGMFDAGIPDPVLTLNVVGTPMSATSLKRLWPIIAAPDVRRWIYEHVAAGDITRAVIRFAAPLSSIGNKDKPLPTEGASIDIAGKNGVLKPAPGLPPLRNAEIAVQATGTSAHAVATNSVVDTPGGRRLTLTQGVLDVPDTVMPNPKAKLSVQVEGPAAAAADMLSTPALKSPGNEQFDPAGIRGNISGTAQIDLTLRQPMTAADVDYAFEADLSDFAVDKIFQGQKLDDATVKLFATPSATLLRGEGKFAGAPASFEINRPRDRGDMTFRFAANLDDGARDRLDIDMPGLGGTVGVKLDGTMNAKDKTAQIELDLTNARLAELVPGWSKPAGKPAKLTADALIRADGTNIDDLVVTGPGVNIRGSVKLDAKAQLVSANLPTFQLSDGDKASVKLEQKDDVSKITVRGEVIEARAFLKSLLDTPIASTSAQKKPADIDLDVNLGVVKGNNGEVLRQAVLQLSRRDGALRKLMLAALVGRNGGVKGDIVTDPTGRPMLQIGTTDAGALLRFVDFYSRIYGGDLWVSVDPPTGRNTPQDGTVTMRDFAIRGEAGIDRMMAAAPDRSKDGRAQAGGTMTFQKLQIAFQRSAGKLQIKDGAVWGPSIGSTFDGLLDFAGDRISVRGTFVPAYGLNNLFSRLPVLGFFLGGGPNEGLVGVTYEIIGPMSGPTLRINPISAVAPGFLRKIFEFRQAPDPRPPALVPGGR